MKSVKPEKVGNNLLENHKCSKKETWNDPEIWIGITLSTIDDINVISKDLKKHLNSFISKLIYCDCCFNNFVMYCDCCGKYFNFCKTCQGLLDYLYKTPFHHNEHVCEECAQK